MGTSTLRNHLLCCPDYLNTFEDENQTTSHEMKDESKSHVFDKEACRKALTRLIIIDELPFSFVEKEGFQQYSKQLEPNFDLPSRRTLARDVYKLFCDEKQKLRNFFVSNKQRVCITIDAWTSIQNYYYMVITAHFIDSEWKLQKRIFNFCTVPDHKGETIGKVIESCLLEWGVERVFTITVDNASSNELAINYVKKKLKNWSENGLVLDGDFLHMRCCAHILNLIVNEGLKDLHVSISRIRNAVKYVKSSPARLKKFKICVEHERIEDAGLVVQDVSTRWNSTYLMLESALKFQKAFERMEDDDRHYVLYFKEDGGPPNSDDWENANVFVLFFKSFYDITLKFSGSMYVTSNLYFHEMCSIHSDLTSLIESGDDLVLSKMAIGMKNKYDKYWGSIDRLNNLLLISVILDPRYKLKYVRFCFEDIFVIDEVGKKSEEVKNLLIRLYEYYKDLDTRIGGCGSSSGAKRYLLEPCEHVDDDDFEILAWWKMNSIKYRVLSHIAKDVFAIPISTVASESAFSTGGRIIDSFRSSLSLKMVEALICSQNWLRNTFVPLQDEPTMEELEFYEAMISEFGSSATTEAMTLD
ncbi:BED-type domain-containing protein [Citrus sinensis]|uniref:BED-type domain-containing protein n=1 Tax=Citrus sinensis TaxID=2711 RepID=A0ACB8IMX9_CITSI|nr:BED-type domain-containing protein [Citrus sinensis]